MNLSAKEVELLRKILNDYRINSGINDFEVGASIKTYVAAIKNELEVAESLLKKVGE